MSEATNDIRPCDWALAIDNATVTTGSIVGSVGVGQSPETGMWAVPSDADDSDQIDFADFSVFAGVFGLVVIGPNGMAAGADLDGSGLVDY